MSAPNVLDDAQDAPLVHLGLTAAALVLLLIGGEITFSDWGTVPARWLALYGLAATSLHAASRSVQRYSLTLRGMAWSLALGSTLHLDPLFQLEVLLPIAAIGFVDLALHRTQALADTELPPGTGGKAIAGAASLTALILLAILIPLAQTLLILFRLGVVILTGWGLITALALQPSTRTPTTLLGAAGALSITFLLLAAPILPYGPMLAYWVLVLSVTLAVTTATFTEAGDPIAPEHLVHEQTVRPLPDPVLAPLAERIRRFIESGHGAQPLSQRLEDALNRDAGGTLLSAMSQARAHGTHPSRRDRRAALAELLEIDPKTLEEATD